MKVLLSWLKELCPADLPVEEVADVLTAQGVEIEAILRPWERIDGVVVARVLQVRDHPKADRLCLATVDGGAGEREVVVGVRNFAPGDLVPYAPPGATIPGLDAPLERRDIRGETSDGMLCSPKELAISTDHEGILVLPDAMQPGADLAEALGLRDAVIDVAVFPNRPDLYSVVGVAREVSAATGADLVLPDTRVSESEEAATGVATVQVRDADRCPRYLARLIRGVRHVPSPLAAQIRLTAAGMRPLGAVVDATNYVLLEMGHPLHPFDLSLLAGGGIVVRRAEEGERLVTLDGVERRLEPEDLVIADHEKAVAIAGVMGSAAAEVGERTADVLLESAYFQPVGVLRTARRLGLRTEASNRFERGADPEAVAPAAARAASLMAAWAGGNVLAGQVEVGEAPPRRSVSVRPSRAAMLLGMDVAEQDVLRAFERLRLAATADGDRVVVEVPGSRVDLEREADLIEEVARVHGYGHIESSLPGIRQAGGLTREQRLRYRIRDALVGAGLLETQSTSFVGESALSLFADDRRDAPSVANPISEEDRFLRTSLLPGLLAAARRSVGHRRPSVRLFEAGTVFRAGEPPGEHEAVAVLVHGPVGEEWPTSRREQDFLDAKGALERLFGALGIRGWGLRSPAGAPYHPGRSATVLLEGEPIGELGEVHPGVGDSHDLPARVAAFELRVGPLLPAAPAEVAYSDVSRFPPVHRDLAFQVDGETPAGAVMAALVEAAGGLLDRVVLFDVFEGDPLPPGKKSLAFTVDLRAPDRTLTDQEAEEVVRGITGRLAGDFGAELRTG